MDDYKKEPGGKERLKEKNPKWINDDYVKFIRFAEHLIEKNGEGVLGFITNHGYLDNPTFRGMRWHLLRTFDKIWVLDLHGNGLKEEVPPSAPTDKNVFDITKAGVAIVVAVKKRGATLALASIFRGDVFGSRKLKETALERNIQELSTNHINPCSPRYFFRDWDYEREPIYERGFSIGDLMAINSNGIVTGDDGHLLAHSVSKLRSQVEETHGVFSDRFVERINYRLFERTFIYNDPALVERNRSDVMQHYGRADQLGFLLTKQVRDYYFAHAFVTTLQSEAICLSPTTATNAMNFPLYLYPDQQSLDKTRRANFDPNIHKAIVAAAKGGAHGAPDEVAIFDYIYGVLHCPAYRETYREFLKIDFPRVPYPPSPDVFWAISAKGSQLRKLHLMEDAAIGAAPFKFTGHGNSVVGKIAYEDGVVRINANQGFENVPEIAWNFYIGGYQPARKWLKDRRGRELSFDDIKHYQKIIKILSETDRIMKTIYIPL